MSLTIDIAIVLPTFRWISLEDNKASFCNNMLFLYLKVQEKFKHIAGGEYIGFSNAT